MLAFIDGLVQKVIDALRGLRFVARQELSFRIELFLGVLVLLFAYFEWPLEFFELFSLLIAYGLVLVTELVNTALETALERLHPERHDLIGRSKDIAAGAVLVSLTVLLVVMFAIAFLHI